MSSILIFDDEVEIASLLAEALKLEGHRASAATSEKEALSLLANTHHDLAFVDLLMPETDGAKFIRECRKQRLCEKYVLMSASREPDDIEPTWDHFLRKPFDLSEVARLIAEVGVS